MGDIMDNMIQVKDLCKKYDDFVALDNINFTLKKGKILAFLGLNGAGKSTTLNILSTLLSQSSGSVKIANRYISKNNIEIKRSIGVVFQKNTLDNDFSVYENLYQRAYLYYENHHDCVKEIDKICKLLNIEHLLNKTLKHCSGGQMRIIQIARALIHHPQLLILDEPSAGLDPSARKLVWDSIMTIQKHTNLTIFYSTHYMEEVKYADEICCINDGKIIVHDELKVVMNKFSKQKLIIEDNNITKTFSFDNPKSAISELNKHPSLTNFWYIDILLTIMSIRYIIYILLTIMSLRYII